MHCHTYTARLHPLYVGGFDSRLSFHGENPYERSTAQQWRSQHDIPPYLINADWGKMQLPIILPHANIC